MELTNNVGVELTSMGYNIKKNITKKCKEYNSTLIVFVVVVFVLLIAWALGETLCWAHGGSHFQYYVKLKPWTFKMGCS